MMAVEKNHIIFISSLLNEDTPRYKSAVGSRSNFAGKLKTNATETHTIHISYY